eukprot:758592-Hanusia_phi.AAC.6
MEPENLKPKHIIMENAKVPDHCDERGQHARERDAKPVLDRSGDKRDDSSRRGQRSYSAIAWQQERKTVLLLHTILRKLAILQPDRSPTGRLSFCPGLPGRAQPGLRGRTRMVFGISRDELSEARSWYEGLGPQGRPGT